MFNLGALRGRLILVFCLIIALTIGSTLLHTVQLKRLEQAEASKSELAVPYDHALSDTSRLAITAANDARGYLLTGDNSFINSFEAIHLPAIDKTLAQAAAIYEADTLEAQLVTEIRRELEAWVEATRDDFELFTTNEEAAIRQSIGVSHSLRNKYELLIATATELAHRNVERAEESFTSELRASRTLGFIVSIASVLSAALLALWIVRTMYTEHQRVTLNIEREAVASTFAHELGDALEMAEDCEDIVNVVDVALRQALPSSSSHLMLANSSESNLEIVASNSNSKTALCQVTTLWACPAIRRGRTQSTLSSNNLDACPMLKDLDTDACSANCSPVMFMGRPLGVLHATNNVDHNWQISDKNSIREVSGAVGNRLGVLRMLEQSKLQAATDALTGLSNRRTLEDRLNKLLHSRTPCVVAMCDLDKFKEINDTFGHDIGDRSLRRFARLLKEATRSEDLVARYGGDEFVIVFPDLAETDAIAALERVRESLAIVTGDGRTPEFTASFGICGSDDASDLDETIQKADEALLGAKKAGRNRVMSISQCRLDSLSSPLQEDLASLAEQSK